MSSAAFTAFNLFSQMHAEEPGSDAHAALMERFADASAKMTDADRQTFAATRERLLSRHRPQ